MGESWGGARASAHPLRRNAFPSVWIVRKATIVTLPAGRVTVTDAGGSSAAGAALRQQKSQQE